MGRLLLLAVVLLLTGCSDSDAPGDRKKERMQVELRPYAPSLVEFSPVQTRAFPGDYRYVTYNDLYSNFTPQQSLVDATIHTFFISKDDGTIEHLNPSEIERYCLWEGERGQLINAFISAGVLTDNPLRIAYDGLWETYFVNGLRAKRTAATERKRNSRANTNTDT